MNNDEPLAFFITWTVYGTHLQGDIRGWRKRRSGSQQPQPRLAQWRKDRLKHPIILLNDEQRAKVESAVRKHCDHRSWHLWKVNARTNHVHVVVTATGYDGAKVRDQLKANATRELREEWKCFHDRPVWTKLGDWECVNSEDDLAVVIQYVDEAQDRKERDQ